MVIDSTEKVRNVKRQFCNKQKCAYICRKCDKLELTFMHFGCDVHCCDTGIEIELYSDTAKPDCTAQLLL